MFFGIVDYCNCCLFVDEGVVLEFRFGGGKVINGMYF